MLEESFESSVVGLDLSTACKRGGNLGEIDRFDFEQAMDEVSKAFNAREMPTSKVDSQDIDEYGSLGHGIVSSSVGEAHTTFHWIPHYRKLFLTFQ